MARSLDPCWFSTNSIGGYRFVSIQPAYQDPITGKHKRIYLGTLDDSNKFIAGSQNIFASIEERSRRMLRYVVRNCTSFVAWCLNSRNGDKLTNQYKCAPGDRWGDAAHWGIQDAELGIPVDNTPAVGSDAWMDSPQNHVAWVKEVKGDKAVVEEYNNGGLG